MSRLPHDTASLARILADSGIDLFDDDKLVEHLIGRGIRPDDFVGNWHDAKLQAIAIRETRRSGAGAAAYAATTLLAFLGALRVSPVRADEAAATLADHVERGIFVLLGLMLLAVFVRLAMARTGR